VTTSSHIVLKLSFTIRKKMVQNMMFVSHNPRSKRASSTASTRSDIALLAGIFSLQNPARIAYHNGWMFYALTVGCCGEPQPGTGGVQSCNALAYGLVDSFQGGVIHAMTTQYTLSAWSIAAHEAIAWRTWWLTDNLLVIVTPSILTDIKRRICVK